MRDNREYKTGGNIDMAKIGFIGMGNIGYAIMRSLLNKYKTEDITFTDLNRRRVAQIEKETGVKAGNRMLTILTAKLSK